MIPEKKMDMICRNALHRYGPDKQVKMLFEEIADVMIMCRQMALLFGEKNVEEQVEYKLARLEWRLAQ